jgi:hypothetical protein
LRRKKRGRLFKRTTQQVARIAKQIIAKFPELIESERPAPQADPFVVALAVFESKHTTFSQKCVLLTEEKFSPSGRPRIPHLCEEYKLLYMSIHQMFISEGWTF